MANTTDYKALYEAIGVKLLKHISSNDYNIINVLRCAGNVSEGSQVERLLDVVLKQDVEADQKIKELEEQMEDMYDEEGVIADRHTFGLVLEDEFDKLKEENKKLKEENSDKTHWQKTMVAYIEECDEWCHFDDWFGENGIDEDDKKHEWVKKWIENKCYESEEESEEESEDEKDDSLMEKFLERHNISEDDMKELMEQCGGRICPEDEESEEETDKYDGDDWRWVYGKMKVKNDDGFDDVVLCMAGGGDHWENWIMRPSMNYIENTNGLHPQHGKDLIQSSCGKYVSFQDKDYVPDDGECICEYEISVECC